MDCQLIEYCIWNTEEQQQKVGEIVAKCIKENGLEYNTSIEDIIEQIDKFNKYVTENFYDVKIIYTPVIYDMEDGSTAYKIVSPRQIQLYRSITPYYLDPDYEHGVYQRTGAYYDQNTKKIGDYNYFYFEDNSFTIENDTVSFIDGYESTPYSFKIETQEEEKLEKNKFVFENSDILQLRRGKADEDYNLIHNGIESEIKKIDDFITKQSEPYKANLFARQNCCNVIMNSVKASKKELEDALVELDKVRERYQ